MPQNVPTEKIKDNHKKLQELYEEKKALEADLASVPIAVKTESNNATYQNNTLQDVSIYQTFKDNYPTFFEEQEGEPSFGSSEFNKFGRLNKIMEVKSYLKEELRRNIRSTARLQEESRRLLDPLYSSYMAKGESSKTSGDSLDRGESSQRPSGLIEEGRLSKRKADHLDEGDNTPRKAPETPSDYIDSLPELPYNPIDD